MIGERVFYFDVLDSTNDYALKNHDNLHDGDVIVALEQRKGRGRRGRNWESPKGGLWFSIVFKPREILDENFYTKLASVSMINVLKDMGIEALIKWPNDIVVNDRKLCGILTEGVFKGVVPKVIVVGVGVNVNNDLSEKLKDTATNLKSLLGREIPITDLLKEIISEMESSRKRYSSNPGALTRVWKGYLNLREGDLVKVNEKIAQIESILPDRLFVIIDGEVREVFEGVDKI